MFQSLVSLALVSAFALQGALADFSVVTPPTLVQCQSVKLEWSGASAGPVDIIFVDPKNPCDSVLADLGSNNTGTSREWTVALASGTPTQVSLLDSAGDEAWSGVVTVKDSADKSCLKTSGSSTTTATTTTATAATTLVVPAANAAAGTIAASSTPAAAVPVGAANAGDNPDFNGASTFARFSAPVVAISTIAAIILSAM